VPRGTIKLKKKEFTDLKQGSMIVNEYLNSFIQLSRYTTEDINTDEKKQDMFLNGLMSYPVPRKRKRSLHTCAQDVQITRMATI
jgi:hypothetical protein